MDANSLLVLNRSRDNSQIFWASLAPMLPISFVVIGNLELNVYSISFLVLAYLVSLAFWFTNGTKPAAWIKDDILHIRDGVFGQDEIDKKKVESMYYEVDFHRNSVGNSSGEETDVHIIVIKLKGFSEWRLPIKDLEEHAEKLRLYHFIKDNFFNLEFRRL
jgi:hypothetical protein